MPNLHSRCIQDASFSYEFSICTLVTKPAEYKEMLCSFEQAGFGKDFCEFLHIDNSHENHFDGYQGLNIFLRSANGKYIIICHQDVLLNYDNVDVLRSKIIAMNALDPHWAVLGNAGYSDFNTSLARISDPYGDDRVSGHLPALCKSLDENFLIVKSEANLAVSHDLHGFHFYATDLCLVASTLGWNTYVIDFHLRHNGTGTCDNLFLAAKQAFIEKYTRHSKARAIRTTCAMLIITGSRILNTVLNRKFFYSVKKRWDYLKKSRRSTLRWTE